ncbi:MAG: YihY/virulence factor BrkB family protein [Acidobacteriota bacterium]|nr:YihY/virulence factor BrkB family protein [Acidobacteriota bacterium]
MFAILKHTLANWLGHRMPRHAAALAFFTLFALAPIVLATVFAAGRFLGEEYVRSEALDIVREFIGPAAAQTLQQIFSNWQPPTLEWGPGLVALGALVFAATAFFVQLHDSLNIIWHVESERSAVAFTLYRRLLSFAMVLISGVVLLALFAVNAALTTFHRLLTERFDVPVDLFEYLNLGASLAITAVLLAALFHFVPDARVRWRDAVIGGSMTAVLFVAGKWLMGRYLRVANLASAYGAAGSLVVTLIWVYYCSLIILLGAEFTYAYSERRRTTRERRRP